jgi:mRNA interferase YafQ
MLDIVPSNQFRKDLKLARKRGMKLELLQAVVDTLAKEQPLDARYRDHSLAGDYRGFRECHIEPDWLLVYRIDQGELELFLFRTGTHADLF